METKFSWQLMHIMSPSFKLIISPLPSNLIDKKIDEITQLKSGWHFGEGETPSEEIIKIARKVVEIGMGMILEANIFPTIEGGVIIVFYGENEYSAEIEIDSQRNLSISYQKGFGFDYNEIQYIEKALMGDIIEICQKLSAQDSSDLSTQDFLIKEEVDSSVPVSAIHQGTKEFPLSIETVSKKPEYLYAPI